MALVSTKRIERSGNTYLKILISVICSTCNADQNSRVCLADDGTANSRSCLTILRYSWPKGRRGSLASNAGKPRQTKSRRAPA